MFQITKLESEDTRVRKYVFTADDAVAEAVLYQYPDYLTRTVICISVQSGCAVGCSFCGTGRQFVRDLTAEEIIFQATHCLHETGHQPSEINKLQIMFMSMGEPFLNYDNLTEAIKRLHVGYPHAQLLVSTSAPLPAINRYFPTFTALSQQVDNIGIQFSVHESNDEDRKRLIPTHTASLKAISMYGKYWLIKTGRKPFFNYGVHANNSNEKNINELLHYFEPSVWECTLSVICEKDETVHYSRQRHKYMIESFARYMTEAGYSLRVFDPAGQDDIGGGCGQLWATQRWLNENRQNEKIK